MRSVHVDNRRQNGLRLNTPAGVQERAPNGESSVAEVSRRSPKQTCSARQVHREGVKCADSTGAGRRLCPSSRIRTRLDEHSILSFIFATLVVLYSLLKSLLIQGDDEAEGQQPSSRCSLGRRRCRQSTRLLLSQRGQRINPCRAPSWDVARHKSRSQENKGNTDQRSHIHCADVIQGALPCFPNQLNTRKPNCHCDQGRPHSFADPADSEVVAAEIHSRLLLLAFQ
jgi:hypothetical protein